MLCIMQLNRLNSKSEGPEKNIKNETGFELRGFYSENTMIFRHLLLIS